MRASLGLKSTVISDPGTVRAVNGDTVAMREPATPIERLKSGSIWVIADGVGSSERAVTASRLAAETIVDAYWSSAIPDPAVRLRSAVERANTLLLEQNPEGPSAGSFAGATALACVIVDDRLFLAHVGRSRAYLLRDGGFRALTEDHSWVAQQIRRGLLTPEEATDHPRSNVITRGLGVSPSVTIDPVAQILLPGDHLLLCSDGLHRALDDGRIAVLLERYGADAAAVLVDEAKRSGGQDNVTAITIATGDLADEAVTALDRLALLNRLGRELTMSLDLNATLRSVLEQLLTMTGGERAAILLREEDGRLRPGVTHNMRAERDVHSGTVADEALRDRRPILVPNALDDPRFAGADSVASLGLRSILCVPMIVKEDAIGVLYVDSVSTTVAFDQDDLDLLVSFASQAAAAIQNARLHEEVVTRTRELEAARRQQNAIFRSLSSGLIAVDRQGLVTHWNPSAEEILGISAGDAVGASLMKILPARVASWLGTLITRVEGGAQTILVPEEWDGPLGTRPRVVLSTRVARIRDPEGQSSGVVIVLTDRTDLVLMEDARRAENAERQRLRDLFSRYLAPSVVEQLLQSPDAVTLGGSRRNITILFADVRGFTGFSSAHEPEQVVAMLNQYLALATSEIFSQFGTLDKFLGDGVMAIFGAPLELENHALAALQAAVAMRSRLDELRRSTGVHVGFGIGLNTGDAIVGNIGTPQLMSYTAIGDVVNVSARLQSEARSGEILVSDTTLALVADQVEVEELGPLYVKGRLAPVTTYKVLRLKPSAVAGPELDQQLQPRA